MTKFKSDFLSILDERGFIHQCSDFDGLDTLAASARAVGYIGFDCTAPSLHVGSLVQIMMLYWLQQTGNKPIVLMGGGTTRVGDPSGKDETRAIRPLEEIEGNKESIQHVFAKVLEFGAANTGSVSERSSAGVGERSSAGIGERSSAGVGERSSAGVGERSSAATLLDNAEWLTKLNYIEMLRDIGRHFSVNRMLSLESVRMRLEREQEMSFIEFNYQILQAYDFVELARRTGCNLQMGGSDQWGNIVTGVDLGRRMGTHQLYALTTPLLTTSSGAKMGKTAAGAVWLNEDQLSAYDYWQFWRNTGDADVGRFLKLFTTLPMDEIERLAALEGAELNEAKKVLATEATALIRGRAEAEAAAATAATTFERHSGAAPGPGGGASPGPGGGASLRRALATGLPTIEIKRSDLEAGLGVLNAFVVAGLVASNGEARRHIQGGGLRVNDAPISDVKALLSSNDLTQEGVIKLSLGRKRHVLLRPL